MYTCAKQLHSGQQSEGLSIEESQLNDMYVCISWQNKEFEQS